MSEVVTDQVEEQGTRTRGIRRTIAGTVTSAGMDKTVVVTVTRRIRDKRFHKLWGQSYGMCCCPGIN